MTHRNESTRIHQAPLWHLERPKSAEGARGAYIVIGIHRTKYMRNEATNQFARGTFLTHRVIISWINESGQHLYIFRSTITTHESGLGLVIWDHVAKNPLSPVVK